MRKLQKAHKLIRYHRAFQWFITLGILTSTALMVYFPQLTFEALIFNTCTCLIWVWEPRSTL